MGAARFNVGKPRRGEANCIYQNGNLDEKENKTHTVDRGHAKSFCVGVLEVIKTGEGVVSEARCSGVNKIGALGVLKDLLEGAFHSRCGVWIEGKVVVKMSTNK